MHIRLATAADIPAILALEQGCASAAHWTEIQYRSLFLSEVPGISPRLVLVAEENSAPLTTPSAALLGFLIAHKVEREWELENIAVALAARGKGIANQMLEELFHRAHEANGQSIFLEVRESNHPARSLYEKLGFTQAGCRKAYYQNPPEDAILYRHGL